ncbi:hypothetical protein EJ08DRAFT_184155 [Tothia fuscella]|uniref:SWR1-complex protein 5 n=1 Tax=Tothia fuscella TaxID=1048955 RepID=A0A9P4NUB6_9PEZI|nr:hypothetical protein EJ08DRAFT_184155 [Tothia fuscella]
MLQPQSEPVEHDDDYKSAEDEDFNPEAQNAEPQDSSSEEDAAPKSKHVKNQNRKRARHDDDVIDAELDSEDDKLIANAKKRRKKQKKSGSENGFSDESGGEGGLIKTRAQRRQEPFERRALARTDGATIDVDALWKQLSSMPIGRPPEAAKPRPVDNPDDYIIIKRNTTFAGQTTKEERRVLKSSAEARVYLAEQEAQRQRQSAKEAEEQANLSLNAASGEPQPSPRRRPLKRPSRFEPNPLGEVKGLAPHLQLRWPRNAALFDSENVIGARGPPRLDPATKLNTVQKSKQDWASYVDKAGIAEELDEYGKSKQSYAGRAALLNRLESQREGERLQAKQKTT